MNNTNLKSICIKKISTALLLTATISSLNATDKLIDSISDDLEHFNEVATVTK